MSFLKEKEAENGDCEGLSKVRKFLKMEGRVGPPETYLGFLSGAESGSYAPREMHTRDPISGVSWNRQ